MLRKKKLFKTFIFLFAFGIILAGCEFNGTMPSKNSGNKENSDGSTSKYILLSANKWTNGNIVDSDDGGSGEQWFKFVATASTQYVYVKFSTSTHLYVYLYDTDSNQIGNSLNAGGNYGTSAGQTDYMEKQLNIGTTYCIKVEGNAGSFWIGFTDFPAQPESVINELSENIWTSGSIIEETDGGTGEQWYKLVATASTQYVYVKFGTSTHLYAYIYDSDFNQIGSTFNAGGNYGTSAGAVEHTDKQVSTGKIYYIKVNGNSGKFSIAFNSTGTTP